MCAEGMANVYLTYDIWVCPTAVPLTWLVPFWRASCGKGGSQIGGTPMRATVKQISLNVGYVVGQIPAQEGLMRGLWRKPREVESHKSPVNCSARTNSGLTMPVFSRSLGLFRRLAVFGTSPATRSSPGRQDYWERVLFLVCFCFCIL